MESSLVKPVTKGWVRRKNEGSECRDEDKVEVVVREIKLIMKLLYKEVPGP